MRALSSCFCAKFDKISEEELSNPYNNSQDNTKLESALTGYCRTYKLSMNQLTIEERLPIIELYYQRAASSMQWTENALFVMGYGQFWNVTVNGEMVDEDLAEI